MKKNSGASDLFIHQSNWALNPSIGRNAEPVGPKSERLAGHGHPVHKVCLYEVKMVG
jgi:hypothetical protein